MSFFAQGGDGCISVSYVQCRTGHVSEHVPGMEAGAGGESTAACACARATDRRGVERRALAQYIARLATVARIEGIWTICDSKARRLSFAVDGQERPQVGLSDTDDRVDSVHDEIAGSYPSADHTRGDAKAFRNFGDREKMM